MRRLAAAAVLLASLLAPTSALADPPSTMSYQGVLTNDVGTFVPDGNYNLTFRLYDVPGGGVALHSENFPSVAVERGGFSVLLGSISSLPVIFDRPLYLGVQVGADPELAPRVALASSPYAMALRLPVVQTQTFPSPLLELRNTTGATAKLEGFSEIGGGNQSGRLDLYRAALPTVMGQWYTTPEGASLDFYDEAANATVLLQSDASGSGGMLSIRRNTANSGFLVDGNHNGTNEPQVLISGSARSATFDMGLTGNESVVLPSNAIWSIEMFDEPGVASVNQSSSTVLDGTVQTLSTRTINVPSQGYCLVIGTVEAQLTHTNGVTSSALFGVSDAAGVFPTTQGLSMTVSASAPTGTYIQPVTVQAVFSVFGGNNTFYLLGDENAGSFQTAKRQLSILYVPTAYGTVSVPGPAAIVGNGQAAVSPEAREAEAFHRARLDREMATMQAQMDELRQKLERVESEQSRVAVRKEK